LPLRRPWFTTARSASRDQRSALSCVRGPAAQRPDLQHLARRAAGLHSPSGHQAAREAYREREGPENDSIRKQTSDRQPLPGSAEGSPGGQGSRVPKNSRFRCRRSRGGQSCLSGSRSAAENQLLPSEAGSQPKLEQRKGKGAAGAGPTAATECSERPGGVEGQYAA